MWKPITETELSDEIQKSEFSLEGQSLNFWNLIKISPEKWDEPNFGNEGGGFWVIAICGRKIIWYNDIEDGFNISDYTKYGKIDNYYCNQDDLNTVVLRLIKLISFKSDIIEQRSSPKRLNIN